MKLDAAFAALLLTVVTAQAQPGILTGPPDVVDARRMLVAGHEVVLAGIEAPPLGTQCRIDGRPFDCGRLARAGLMDLVVGAEVECRALPAGGHRCLAGGYDLAFGLVHAGWAVPTSEAPDHYHSKMREAQARSRGLWSAKPESGEGPTLAHRLGH